MPLDVIMPALGMAQDTGLIVAWHKQPGEAVTKGDVLFEVETDKATMEVEAPADGYLTDVAACAGTDVPVGNIIAKISDRAESLEPSSKSADASAPTRREDLPAGQAVIMPTLGMAQDTGLLVRWHKQPGDAVIKDDVLFEVETDKSLVEVTADTDGYLAAVLATEGEEVPVGQTIAIISTELPEHPMTRSSETDAAKSASKASAPAPQPETVQAPASLKPAAPPAVGERILASPKLRRMAREQGLDLKRLVAAGYPQPFHVKDLKTLGALSDSATMPGQTDTRAPRRIVAEIVAEGFTSFAEWAAETGQLTDDAALLAGLCAASKGQETVVLVETFGTAKTYRATSQLRETAESDDAAQLRIRDLRFSSITTVQVGAEDMPTLTVTRNGDGLTITLEFATVQLSASHAIELLSNFAGRMEQPLRHLL